MHTFNETCMSFCPFGSGDIQRAIDVLNEMDCEESLYDLCKEYASEIDMKIEDLDPVWVVYDHALQEFRAGFESTFDVDIQNFTTYIDVYANYIDTRFNYNPEWREKVIEILKSNPEQDWSNCAKFVFEECEIDWRVDSKED